MSPVAVQKAKLFGALWLPLLGLRCLSVHFPVLGYSGYVPGFVTVAGVYAIIVSILELARRMRQADAEPADLTSVGT